MNCCRTVRLERKKIIDGDENLLVFDVWICSRITFYMCQRHEVCGTKLNIVSFIKFMAGTPQTFIVFCTSDTVKILRDFKIRRSEGSVVLI